MISRLFARHIALRIFIILVLIYGINFSTRSKANAQVSTEAVCNHIISLDRAYFAADKNVLKQLLVEAYSIKTDDAAYVQGLAHYRLAILAAGNRGEMKKQLNPAIDLLEERLNKSGFGSADERALLSGIYGLKISSNFLSAIRLGPKSSAAAELALAEAAKNPRVLLLDGIRLFNTPARFGGDRALAMRRFQAALATFEEPNNVSCWGQGDAYYWTARALIADGNVEAGLKLIEKFKTLYPGSPFVGNLISLAKEAG